MKNFGELFLLNSTLEIFAALITASLLISCIHERQWSGKQGIYLTGLMASHTAMLLFDAATWPTFGHASRAVIIILIILTYTLMYLSITLFTGYLVTYILQKAQISVKFLKFVAVLGSGAVAIWSTSPIHKLCFYFDENGALQNGSLYLLSILIGVLTVAADMVVVLCYSKSLGRRDTLFFLSYGLIPIASTPLIAILGVTPIFLAITWSLVIIYVNIHMEKGRQVAEQQKKIAEKNLEISDTRLRLLLGQIQPHFIFNSLLAIQELCVEDPPKAERMVNNFSKYLRGNLDSMTCDHLIPFERELEHIKHYIALEQSDPTCRFSVVYNLKTTDFEVPPLSVQPIVENAIRHGIGSNSDGGTVTISTDENDEFITIIVHDDGSGFSSATREQKARLGVGIQNVRTRLEVQCKGELNIESEGNGTYVTISIPRGE